MLSGPIYPRSQQDFHDHDGKALRDKATIFRARVKTHLAGFERKRSRSFLHMSHGCLYSWVVFERVLLYCKVLEMKMKKID